MRAVCQRFSVLAFSALAAISCAHGDFFSAPDPARNGPPSNSVPRRLTYSSLSDGTPSTSGGMLVFSRQGDREPGEYLPTGRERCIAIMPTEGGSIEKLWCPHQFIAQPDTFVDTWFDPALSPDGQRIAFSWQRGLRVSAIGFVDAYLMVTPIGLLADTTGVRHQVRWVETGGAQNPLRATVATRISWEDDNSVLFLATYEHILKVKGGGAERVTDTTFDGLALMRLDVRSGAAMLVAGGDSVVAYAAAQGGGLWIAKKGRPEVWRLDPVTGVATPAGAFSQPVVELVDVAGMPVGITLDSLGIEYIAPGGPAQALQHGFPGKLHRLAAASGRRFILEVEDGTELFGSPPDLWLLAIP